MAAPRTKRTWSIVAVATLVIALLGLLFGDDLYSKGRALLGIHASPQVVQIAKAGPERKGEFPVNVTVFNPDDEQLLLTEIDYQPMGVPVPVSEMTEKYGPLVPRGRYLLDFACVWGGTLSLTQPWALDGHTNGVLGLRVRDPGDRPCKIELILHSNHGLARPSTLVLRQKH
jgi:hypothetical protein